MKLQDENINKLNILVKVHHREIDDFKIKKFELKEKVESQTQEWWIETVKFRSRNQEPNIYEEALGSRR